MTYKLYYSPDSANLPVRMAMEELGLHYDHEQVPRKRVDRTAEFMSLNPRGLLPVLIDDDTGEPVFETGAILLYLAEKHNGLMPGTDALAEKGRFLKWMFMLSNTVHADLAMNFYPERFVTIADDMQKLRAAIAPRVQKHMEMLDSALAEHGGPHFLRSGLSCCDFYIGCLVRWAQLYPGSDPAMSTSQIERNPHLTAMLSSLQERNSVRTALEKEGITGPAFLAPVPCLPIREADPVGSTLP